MLAPMTSTSKPNTTPMRPRSTACVPSPMKTPAAAITPAAAAAFQKRAHACRRRSSSASSMGSISFS